MTREHLVPRWLVEVLVDACPSDGGYDFAHVFTTEDGEGSPRTFEQIRPEIVVKAVCEPCNGGWMSELEQETMPILEPLVRGDSARLDVGSQVTLARWAAKVAVLLDHYEAGSVVLAPGDMEQISRFGQAPTGFHIRLAFRDEKELGPFNCFLTTHLAEPIGESRDSSAIQANSFSATLGLGRVAIAVIGGPGVSNPGRWVEGGDLPLMIWPPTISGLEWPPMNPVLRSHDDLMRFHESFWARIRNPEFPRPNALGHPRAAEEDDGD